MSLSIPHIKEGRAGASCPQSASTSLSWACTWPWSLSKKRTSKTCHLKPSLTRSCWAISSIMCWLTLPTGQGWTHKTRTFLHLAAFVEHSATTREVTSPDNNVQFCGGKSQPTVSQWGYTDYKSWLRTQLKGVGEMAQWLREFVLTEDPGSIPSTYMVL